jgi:cytochrome P450
MADTTVDNFDTEYLLDPYAVCRRLREERPVAHVVLPQGLRVYLVTRYADVRAALADPRLGKDSGKLNGLFQVHYTGPRSDDEDITDGSLDAHMLNSDPPDHERLRRLVNKAFTSRRIEQLRPRIEEITRELLDGIGDRTEIDLLDEFAFPLPITVICELLGMSMQDADDFRRWSNLLISGGVDDEVRGAAGSMYQALVELVAAKRAAPGEDMLSALVHARDADDDRLSERELVAMAFLLLVAGHETTVNLIGNGVLALVNNPDQQAELRADRSLLPAAIEEFLRYQGPLNHATLRCTLEAVEIGGVPVPEGEFVVVSLASANRDQRRFGDPEELDIHRDTSGHLAFGHGIHYCLGAPLARLEAEIAFTGLLNRFGSIELGVPADELRWRPGNLIRGLERLPVRLGGQNRSGGIG